MQQLQSQRGFTVLEALIGIALFAIISTTIYSSYSNILDIIQATQYNNAALSIIESNVEAVRNMRYEDIGVVGGAPAGLLPQVKQVTLGSTAYTLHTYVRNIDDPFDGVVGGSPNDSAPADYKLVEFQITCDECTRYKVLTMATYVAPKNLENASRNGNLFVRVLDASGLPVSGATVRVINTAVLPPIDLTDTTNNQGLLQLVSIATSSRGYHLIASKSGYSADQTYPPGAPVNPIKPDATVATQQLTISTLAIDKLATLNLNVQSPLCQPISSFKIGITGAKLIGTQPDTQKYSSTVSTNASGLFSSAAFEWDTYTLRPSDDVYDFAGSDASLSFSLLPNSIQSLTWTVVPKINNSVLLTVRDQNGDLLQGSTIHISGQGRDVVVRSGYYQYNQTQWTASTYSNKSNYLNTSSPESLSLAPIDGSYASSSNQWLISETIDTGATSTSFGLLQWAPTQQQSGVGSTAVQFQIAANNDNATWNWVGPDGTPSTYFTSSGQLIHSSLRNNRYVRYKVLLSTNDPTQTPRINDVYLDISSTCTARGQVLLNGLSSGTYSYTIDAPGYQSLSGSLQVQSGWSRQTYTLTPIP